MKSDQSLKNKGWSLNPLKILRGFFGFSYASPDEKYFVEEAMARRREVNAQITIRIGMLYNVLMIVVLPILTPQSIFSDFTLFHVINLCIITPMLISPESIKPIIDRVGLSYILPVAIVFAPMFYAWKAYAMAHDQGSPHQLMVINHVHMLSSFIIMVHPGTALVRICTTVFLTFVEVLGFSDFAAGRSIVFTMFSSMNVALIITFLIERRNMEVAQREFKLMIQAAPAKIVRQSASSHVGLLQVFAPKLRHCVCISSDWRGYQALSATLATEKLSNALGSYYEMSEKILSQIFPDGNYYTDWIADELFIVAYAKDEVEEKLLINSSLQFASRLIEAKHQFIRDNNLKIDIDIGISSGVALIGMMGPPEHRKATALGDVPGRARRLQVAGKILREKLGERDRVVFGATALFEITAPFDVQEFQLSEDNRIRDFDEGKIFYLEPQINQPSQVA